MKNKMEVFTLSVLAISSLCSLAFAVTPEHLPSPSLHQDGYFFGIGGSYNALKAELHPSGTLTATSGFPPLGIFAGKAATFDQTEYGFAPALQLGYFKHFESSNWLWGLKFLYQYLQINNKENGIYLHYANELMDNKVTASAQTKVSHELAALAFIGHSFSTGHIYLGIGPSLNATEHNLSNISDNDSGYYIGNVDNFSSQSRWLWGGLVQAGVNLYLNPTWFIDLNYSYTITGWHKSTNSATYSAIINGGLNSGMLSFDTSKRITEQALMISINKILSA